MVTYWKVVYKPIVYKKDTGDRIERLVEMFSFFFELPQIKAMNSQKKVLSISAVINPKCV